MSIWRLAALGIATLLLTFAGSVSPNVVSAQQTSVCATGGAVPNPDANPGLVSDCETLLAARDTLAGTGALNWAANTPMLEWDGVSYQGTPKRVTRLELELTGLTGDIPAELGNLSNLETLRLHGNQLTGDIPTELGNLSNLQGLSLGGNQLTGEIPTELGDLSNLQGLWLHGNQLTGELPHSLTGLTVLMGFTFHNNSGLCAPVDEAFQTWLQSVSSVGGSSCAPMDSAEDRAALVELYNATGGASWTNNTNWLSDRPIREWYGVSNDPDGRVSELWLSRNQLTGEIPAELGNLSNLERLWLYDNKLAGDIPRELGSLSNLETLDIGGNQLTGEIPAELGDLSNLTVLTALAGVFTPHSPVAAQGVHPTATATPTATSLPILTPATPVPTASSDRAAGAAQADGLFYDVKGEPPPSIGVDTLASRLVGVDFGLLAQVIDPPVITGKLTKPQTLAGKLTKPQTLALNLFDDVVFTGIVEHVEPTSSGHSLWGRLDGVGLGTFTLVVNGRVVIGTVRMPDAVYTIRTAGDGTYVIRKIDESSLPPLGEPLEGPLSTPEARGESDDIPPDDGSVIDVMVVYTPLAKHLEGGRAAIEALIDLFVVETNQAYAISGVVHRIKLVLRKRWTTSRMGTLSST